MERYILAIDQGTTSSRAIIFDHESRIVAMAQREIQIEFPFPGWVEQDPINIWLSVEAVMAEAIQKANIDPASIEAIGISNQRETSLIWDKKTGLPIYNAIVWQSRQTDQICDRWKEEGLEEYVKGKTGLRIDPYFSASKIAWILDHVEGARQRAEEGELYFGTIDSWLVWKMTGQEVHITDVSNASRTLLFNIETLRWDDGLLEKFNIPKAILPTVCPTSYPYGKTAPYLFYNQSIPICCVVGDQQAALFGQRCIERGMVKNTYGTGGFMLMNTGNQIVRSKNGLLSTIAWQIDDQVTYALEGSIFVSGSLIKWLRDNLEIYSDTSETSAMAVEAKTTGGVYIVPAFVGLGAPYWDEKARAAIVGLTFGTDKNQLVRAALESMAFQSRDVLDVMESDSGIKIDRLKVDGGAAANDFLLQFQSDLLGCDVERFKINELTALGAAYFAGLACGFWKEDELHIPLDKVFFPVRSREEMAMAYRRWKEAVKACRTFRIEENEENGNDVNKRGSFKTV